ncbi:MAG: bile acid 7-alpha dehydratase, partial [Gammaproteobacteria bacterium]|nr:bile acid 7-alpha dehydratase [Gammaproteobacteria bacterium]
MSLEETIDITAISQLVVRERESRDLCMWNRMASCFFADSYVDISWFQGNGKDFVKGSKDMYE